MAYLRQSENDRHTLRLRFQLARVLANLPLLVACVLLFSACANASFGSTFRASGTATHELRITIDRAALGTDRDDLISDAFVLAEEQARTAGLDTRRISSNAEVGLLVSSSTEDAPDAGAALNTLINSLSPSEVTAPVAPFTGTFGQDSPALGGNEYELSLVVNGTLLQDAFDALAADVIAENLPDDTTVAFDVTYQATMPGEIKESDGESIDNNTVRWALPLDTVTEIKAVSSVGKTTPWLLVLGTTLGVAGLIGFVALLIFGFLSRRGRAPVGSSSSLPPATRAPRTHHDWPALRAGLATAISRALRGGSVGSREDAEPVRAAAPAGGTEEANGTHPQGD